MSPEDKNTKKPKANPASKGAKKAAPSEKKAASKPAPKPKAAAPKAKKQKAGAPVRRAPMAPRTLWAKPADVKPKWRLIDASNQTLGRLSTQIATILMGKDKPIYTRFTDTGDFVVVIHASKIRLTGKKLQDKYYYRHSGYPGGIKATSAGEMLEKHPERLIEKAVWGMLPSNHRGRQWMKKLKIYPGESHPHEAQKPEVTSTQEARG